MTIAPLPNGFTLPSNSASISSSSLSFLFNIFIFVIISPFQNRKVYTYINSSIHFMVKKERWGKKWEDNRNWKTVNEHLINRGEYYINPRFLETWIDEIKEANAGKVGEPYLYPNSLIEFLAILHAKGFVFRELQGIVKALSKNFNNFPVISFSQIRRRILKLALKFNAKASNLIAGIDGSGIKVANRGDWIREKWRVQRGWIKVVILGDVNGNIVDIRIGNENLDERAAGRGMIRDNKKNIKKILADGLHDCEDTFNLLDKSSIESGIKIRENASDTGLGPRPREVRVYKEIGYKEWAKQKNYGKRWLATEGIFSASKRIMGEYVNAHKKRNMYHEARLKFWAYQKVKDAGQA